MSSHRFEGKVAVVTGAASGIGAATARLMGKEGARLVLGDLNEAGLTSLAADFEGALISAWCQLRTRLRGQLQIR